MFYLEHVIDHGEADTERLRKFVSRHGCSQITHLASLISANDGRNVFSVAFKLPSSHSGQRIISSSCPLEVFRAIVLLIVIPVMNDLVVLRSGQLECCRNNLMHRFGYAILPIWHPHLYDDIP